MLEGLLKKTDQLEPTTTGNDLFALFKNLSQRQLAFKLGITESHLSRILSGQRALTKSLEEKIKIYKEEIVIEN